MASSAQAVGRAVGPMLGASVASAWGMSNAFLVTAGVFGGIAVLVATTIHPEPRPVETPEAVQVTPRVAEQAHT
jgi:predicted MFS family arabinose efflux permease